jgi:hypothetical protein
MSTRSVALSVSFAIMLAAVRPARAGEPGASAQPSKTGSESAGADPYETRRIVDITLLAAGLTTAAVGGYFAIKYNRAIGSCDPQGINCTQEDGRVPLGLGMLMVGGALAMVGGVLWLQIPSTATRVSVAPNGLVMSGSF